MNTFIKNLMMALGLLLITDPTIASPTSKKITLTCNSTSTNLNDYTIGSETVTLCDTVNLVPCNGGQQFSCPPLTCDTRTQPSASVVCKPSPSFKVVGASYNISFSNFNSAGTFLDGGGTGGATTIGGKAFNITVPEPPNGLGSVTLQIK